MRPSGFTPMNVRGIDLGREAGLAAALEHAIRPGGVGATPIATRRGGTSGLFLVMPAPNLIAGVLRPGAVVVFVAESTLRSAARNAAGLRLAHPSSRAGGTTVHKEFVVAGQQFAVFMPKESVGGAGAFLPWLILAAGLVLAALAGALGVNAARRAKAQADLDRIFRLSSDLIAVANFDGRFTRVNPAAERILGYSEEELLERPYLAFVHPSDRERTAAEAAAIAEGKTTPSFENRYVRKDGSERVLEWTATPVVAERAMYAVARDVTERRRAETELERLAREQAALRRVATLVADGLSPAQVFAAVADEVQQLLDVEATAIARLEPEEMMVIVASGGTARDAVPVGTRLNVDSETAMGKVLRSGRSARIDHYGTSSAPVVERVARLGIRCSVAVPIVVEATLWGSVGAGTSRKPLPDDAEERLGKFTELVVIAIANAESRSELAASRRRIVAATDDARRQLERNLHDGTQQRLAAVGLAVRAAETSVPPELPDLRAELQAIAAELGDALFDVQEISRGIHPRILSHGGLGPALQTLARHSTVPVELKVAMDGRLPEPLEVTAYFVASEALANATKHAQASRIEISLKEDDVAMMLVVRDDGVGGADSRRGSGLVGLQDRVEVLGGRIRIDSPPGGGTSLVVTLPLEPAEIAAGSSE